MHKLRKWIRIPQGEQKRGEGRWMLVSGAAMERDFDDCSRSMHLPIAREFPDRELVRDDRTKTPTYVVEGGWIINQFHNVGVKLRSGQPNHMQAAQRQLLFFLKTVLVIDHEGDPNVQET